MHHSKLFSMALLSFFHQFAVALPSITPLGTPLARPTDLNPVPVAATPTGAADPILDGFVSYSIEFSSFPDFAGNARSPNTFSDNLLSSIESFSGTKPYIRVGGNTQDYALFDENLNVATNGTYTSKSQDYPTILSFGPSYFESYGTWPGAKFIHGFNLAKNSSANRDALLASAPHACKALSNGNLLYWQLGNEPDLYKTSAQGIVRSSSWTEADYVAEWRNWTKQIASKIEASCSGILSLAKAWYAPSFAGTNNSLKPLKTWQSGLNNDGLVAYIDSHK
jgi:hypothetical protein